MRTNSEAAEANSCQLAYGFQVLFGSIEFRKKRVDARLELLLACASHVQLVSKIFLFQTEKEQYDGSKKI